MRIERGHGLEQAQRVIRLLADTGGRPDVGYTIDLHAPPSS